MRPVRSNPRARAASLKALVGRVLVDGDDPVLGLRDDVDLF